MKQRQRGAFIFTGFLMKARLTRWPEFWKAAPAGERPESRIKADRKRIQGPAAPLRRPAAGLTAKRRMRILLP